MNYFTCTVCGDHIGMGFNHDDCKEFREELPKRKKRKGKLTKKQADSLAKHIAKF